jgi:hypothetical protein
MMVGYSMMVVYSTNHTSNCYEMWDHATGGIHTTRHIIWLKRMYFPKVTINPPADGNGIQVTITVQQHSSIRAGEEISIVDSNTIEVDEVDTTNVATVHEDETVEPDEAQEEDNNIPELERPRTRSRRNVKMPDRLIAEMNAAANSSEIQ